jgi:Uma2 family endonuclease
MSALRKPLISRMTVAEFIAWPGDGSDLKHQLVDGEPQAMAPASTTHGRIQATLARLLGNRLVGTGCSVVIEPAVIPRVRAEANMRVPDLAVTCAPDDPPTHALDEPIVLIEILSPTNERETRANVWTYTTIPPVREILLVRSTHIGAELIRRQPDGGWPESALAIGQEGRVELDSIGFGCPIEAFYEGTRFVAADRG